VATGNVARAYSERESAGLIASRRRTGTVVVGVPPQPPAEEDVRQAAARPAVQARTAGLDGEAVLAIVRAALLQAAEPDLTPPG